jgi:hypothetical protein
LLLLRHPVKNLHDHREEHGSKKDSKKGNADHSSEDGCTQGLIHFGAGSFSDHQGQDAKNEGKRGHEDWPQTQPGSFRRSLDPPLSGFHLLPREFHDQDRILAGEPDENNESDLGEDIVVLSSKINPKT